MKAALTICMFCLLISCSDKKSEEIDQLNQRVTQLEGRVDSLVSRRNINLGDTVVEKDRCCARTKKGTQCMRKAKKNSDYCWQHGK